MVRDLPDEPLTDAADAGEARRHALWGLTVLALIAVLVLTLTVFLSGGTSPRGQRLQLAGPTESGAPGTSSHRPVTPTRPHTTPRSTPRSVTRAVARPPTTAVTSSAPRTTSRPPSRTHSPTPAASAGPCRSARPCAVGGDNGAAGALNGAREAQGAPPVPVIPTATAQRCAVSGGSCAGQHAVALVATLDGRRAVSGLVSSSDNAWLLSPSTSSLAVGWAYDPTIGTGEYVCVLLRNA